MGHANNINFHILTWARETAGLSLEEAAHKIGLSSSQKTTATEKLAAMENGETPPTRNQLLTIASVYNRPLIVFYMSAPPVKGDRGEDFRTFPGSISGRDNALLDALLRDLRARQQMVRSLLEDEEDATPLPFVRSSKISDGVQNVTASIRNALGLSIRDHRTCKDSNSLFSKLRNATETIGVFVLLAGDLGSHHSVIGENVFRGFAIADEFAPFIVINDQDARAARSFTLIHELAHIWLGASGVSGSFISSIEGQTESSIEAFCNEVASEFLLPSTELSDLSALRSQTQDRVLEVAADLAAIWNVSQAMVVYRFKQNGWIDETLWWTFSRFFAERWKQQKAQLKEQAKASEGGPSYYTVRQNRLGTALTNVVRRTLRENTLTHTKAAKVLGVRPSSVEPLLRSGDRMRG